MNLRLRDSRRWRNAQEAGRGALQWVQSGSLEAFRVVMVLLIIAGVVAQFFSDKLTGALGLGLAVAVSATVAAIVWVLGEQRAGGLAEKAESTRTEQLTNLGYTLSPLVREVARVSALATPALRRQERNALRLAVVSAASGLSSKAALRANYFELNAAKTAMVPVAFTGRSTPPSGGFKKGKKSGDSVLTMVKQEKKIFCPDTVNEPPAGWVASNNAEYKTFAAVTVGTPGAPVGMLTVDGPQAGDLSDEDVEMMILLGHILGLAEEITS